MIRKIVNTILPKYICIYQKYIGLGDHLQHSTLPKLYNSLGKKVFISNKCKFRNEEIKELVWETNPYVCGFSDMEPNAGMSCLRTQERAVKIWQPTHNSINNIEKAHGFIPSNIGPEIFYSPKTISEYSNFLVFDATAYTVRSDYNKEILNCILEKEFPDDKILFLKNNKISYSSDEDFSTNKYETITVNSIFEYCDVIKSCNKFVCLMSGGHSLAQAIRKNNTFCILKDNLFKEHFDRGLFLNQKLVNYIKL